jgi:hypothetical protein
LIGLAIFKIAVEVGLRALSESGIRPAVGAVVLLAEGSRQVEESNLEEFIEKKTAERRAGLSGLERKLKDGDDSELVHWVIRDRLACSHRPLRHHPLHGGSGKNIAPEAALLVEDWSVLAQCEGIKSIISLMHARDLAYYGKLDLGTPNLIEFYRNSGFEVAHIPWEDPFHSRTSRAQIGDKLLVIREEALAAYDRLAKPVLIQCSAGIDRTAPVAAYIFTKRARNIVGALRVSTK